MGTSRRSIRQDSRDGCSGGRIINMRALPPRSRRHQALRRSSHGLAAIDHRPCMPAIGESLGSTVLSRSRREGRAVDRGLLEGSSPPPTRRVSIVLRSYPFKRKEAGRIARLNGSFPRLSHCHRESTCPGMAEDFIVIVKATGRPQQAAGPVPDDLPDERWRRARRPAALGAVSEAPAEIEKPQIPGDGAEVSMNLGLGAPLRKRR